MSDKREDSWDYIEYLSMVSGEKKALAMTWRGAALGAFLIAMIAAVAGLTEKMPSGWAIAFVVLCIPAAIIAAYRAIAVGDEKEEILSKLRIRCLQYAADGVLAECKKTAEEDALRAEDIMDVLRVGLSEEVLLTNQIEGVCFGGARFRRADVTLHKPAKNETGYNRYGKENEKYYAWTVYKTVKKIREPLVVQSWEQRNLFFFDGAYEEFETEDMEFNGKFFCACDNGSEAFYVLTPPVMSDLTVVYEEKAHAGKPFVTFFFRKNELHVFVLRDTPHFDFDGDEEIDIKADIADMRSEFEEISRNSELLEACIQEEN